MSVGISNNYMNIQEKPAFCGTKANKLANKWRRELKHIDLTPGSPISDAFVKEMAQGIESLGIVGKKIINPRTVKLKELKYKLAQKTSDAFPELKKLQPRGWPKDLTWDNNSCIHRGGGKRLIGLFEKPIGIQPQASISSVRHDTSHELDEMFHKICGDNFTDTKGFTRAYLGDIKNSTINIRKYGKKVKNADHYINYLIQGSTFYKATEGGKKETFAEIFAMLNGGSAQEEFSKGMDKLYKQVFPNTVAYVEKLLGLLGKR